ncbi:MAG: cytochrome b/b6 domain-containing protein [Longimicrobiales bacterium]
MSEPRYSRPARLFHWAVSGLVAVTIPVGIAMTSEGFRAQGDVLYITHKGIGVVLLVLVLARAAYRVVVPPPPLPDSVPDRERRIAGATHVLLYVLLVVQGVTGYLRTVAGDFPIELLDVLGVPPLIGEHPDLARRLSVAHKIGAYALVATVSVHVAAVLHHALILRDGILGRMWPP